MELSAEATLVGNAGDSIVSARAQRRVQIVKIKRVRNEDPQEGEHSRQKKAQRRKLGKEAVMQFKSLGRTDITTRPKRRITKRRVRPRSVRMQMHKTPVTRKERREANRGFLRRVRRRQHKDPSQLSRRELAALDAEVYKNIKKFMPYRERAFDKDNRDYFLTVFYEMFPQPDKPLTIHQEQILAYRLCTDARERRRLRKDYPVVREMAKAEEGIFTEEDSSESEGGEYYDEEEEYDYYVEDDPAVLEQYLDADGNLIDGVSFGACESVTQPADRMTKSHPASNDSDSVKDYFGSDEDEPMAM